MSESYLERAASRISEEQERRRAVEIVHRQCVQLIREHGFFNAVYEEMPLELPTVEWDDEGSLLMPLLRGEHENSLHAAELRDVKPIIHWSLVTRVDLLYFPRVEGMLTVAYIELHGGVDGTTVISDVKRDELSVEDVESLSNDLTRYANLIRAGKLEKPVRSEDRLS